MKEFSLIIKEEINKFNNDPINLFNDDRFQVKFIKDVIEGSANVNATLIDGYIKTVYEEKTRGDLPLEAQFNIIYEYLPNQKIQFDIILYSNQGVNFVIDSDYDQGSYNEPPYGTSWFSVFEYNDIIVELFNKEGDEIKFTAFNNINDYLQRKFIKWFIEGYVEKETGMRIKS
jgi:hypothetical protein